MKGVRNPMKPRVRIGVLLGCLLTSTCFLHGFGVLDAAESGVATNGSETMAPPNHEAVVTQINQHVQQGYRDKGLEPASPSGNRAFVRRVYLDLVGRIPKVAELERCLENGIETRQERGRLIQQLLQSEEHVIHWADLFDTLLMGRAAEDKYMKRRQHQWRAFLENSIRTNQPWNEFVEEVLLARPSDATKKGGTWFLFERNNDYQKIAEAIAPAVFGIRIECAQCHDHMLVDEIKQSHYWGLVAFFNRGKNENGKAGPQVTESAIGGFSDFADLLGDSTPNRLAFLEVDTVEEERPTKDEKQADADDLYRAGQSENVPRVPMFSRREKFVTKVVRDHPRVARALVNRVWALLMGRGIVHPYDEMDSIHAPSHPELLDWLSRDFRDNDYNVRRLIRAIVSSDAYRLASRRPEDVDDPATFAYYLERSLTGEQLARSTMIALFGDVRDDQGVNAVFRQQFPDLLPDQQVANIRESLFLSNGQKMQDLLAASNQPTHLIPRLAQMDSAQEQVNLLFEVMFARVPDAEENAVVKSYLSKRGGTAESIRQVAWSMLTSAEFRYNH
jgi:hypothetical protein